MSRFPSPRPFLYLSSALLVVCLWACGGSDDSSESDPSYHYSARGVVRQVPVPPGQELYIHHEEIPDFVNIDGEVQGMGSMAMPFPISETPLPPDLKAGDKVAFQFEVQWNGSPPMRLLSLEKLPPETVLSFEAPTEASDAASEASTTEHEGHEGGHEHEGEAHDGSGHEGHEPAADETGHGPAGHGESDAG